MRRVVVLLVAVVVVVAALGVVATASGGATPARVVAVVPSGKLGKLVLLDARTLQPARPGWSRAVGRYVPAALSPAGSRVAIGTGNEGRSPRVLVLDATTGRRLGSNAVSGSDGAIYWLGGEGTRRTRVPLIIITFTSSKGDELQVVGEDQSTVSNVPILGVLRDGLVLAPDATPSLLVVWPNESLIQLPNLPSAAPFRVVADVLRDRLYVISSAGTVATVNRASTEKPAVVYHRVSPNGKPFDAAWAGEGRIALWGEDGLGTIDTRTWTTHPIAPGVTDALATPYGVAAWTKTAEGLRVYRPDGRRRLHLLQGQQITSARAVGPYLYADTNATTRYAIDLRTGKTSGPLPAKARIVAPSYVVIP